MPPVWPDTPPDPPGRRLTPRPGNMAAQLVRKHFVSDPPDLPRILALVEDALNQPSAYPTEDAYMRACRALHWRTAQLRAHGVEPIRLTDDMGHEPPEDFDFASVEAAET